MKYKTCISIGENSPKKIKNKLKDSLKKSDYVEVSLDFLKAKRATCLCSIFFLMISPKYSASISYLEPGKIVRKSKAKMSPSS